MNPIRIKKKYLIYFFDNKLNWKEMRIIPYGYAFGTLNNNLFSFRFFDKKKKSRQSFPFKSEIFIVFQFEFSSFFFLVLFGWISKTLIKTNESSIKTYKTKKKKIINPFEGKFFSLFLFLIFFNYKKEKKNRKVCFNQKKIYLHTSSNFFFL